MTKTRVRQINKKSDDKAIDKLMHEALDMLVGEVMTEVSAKTPIEDGHAHEAWLKAATGVNAGIKHKTGGTSGAISALEANASGDALATGTGTVTKTAGGITARLRNDLGFVAILEDGGVINTIRPHGIKEASTKKSTRNIRPGQRGSLFSKRLSRDQGMGFVFWTDSSGANHFAHSRKVSAGRYVESSIQSAKVTMASLGGKAK